MNSTPADGPPGNRDWNLRYRQHDTPWDTGVPSRELVRALDEAGIAPCRAIELGCGTGSNAVFLAQCGFSVTAVDISSLAIARARRRAASAGVELDFIEADICKLPAPAAAYDFVFDRGCYHCVRRDNLSGFIAALGLLTRAGSIYLLLAGNAEEPSTDGPPRVHEHEIRGELGGLFAFDWIRPFRFEDPGGVEGPLGWSCLMTRKAPAAS